MNFWSELGANVLLSIAPHSDLDYHAYNVRNIKGCTINYPKTWYDTNDVCVKDGFVTYNIGCN